MTFNTTVPVIAIDGPTASGKGTVSAALAKQLGFHYLDSGAIYRALAVAVLSRALSPSQANDMIQIQALSQSLNLLFKDGAVLLDGRDVSLEIRTEKAGLMASELAAFPVLRANLLQRQRGFLQPPGLVADGRDMGTVVFPQAIVKVFLTASAEVRAKRRLQQLQRAGGQPDFDQLLADLKRRDAQDAQRSVSPLKPADHAVIIDSSDQTIEQIVNQLYRLCQSEQLVEK